MSVVSFRRLVPALLVPTALLTLTACGGSAKQDPAPASSTPAAASSTAPKPSTPTPAPTTTAPVTAAPAEPLKLTITLKDFSFEPKEFTATKGQKVMITLKNDGEKKHDITLQGAYDGMKSEQIAPGAQGTFEFVADKPGTFEFICDLKGHKDRGMVGKFTVTEK